MNLNTSLTFKVPIYLVGNDKPAFSLEKYSNPSVGYRFTGSESLSPGEAEKYVIENYGEDYLRKIENHVLSVYGKNIGKKTVGNLHKRNIDKQTYLSDAEKRKALLNTMKLTPAQMILLADANQVKMPKELMFAWIQQESGFGRYHTKDNHTRNLFGYGEYDDGTWDEKWHLKDPIQNFSNVLKQIDRTYFTKSNGEPFDVDELLSQKFLKRKDGEGVYNTGESYVPTLKAQYNFIKKLK